MEKIKLVDLGGAIGKITINSYRYSPRFDLDIILSGCIDGAGNFIHAVNIPVSGKENIIALKNALTEALEDFEQMAKEEKKEADVAPF
jgi:hypothetical protein